MTSLASCARLVSIRLTSTNRDIRRKACRRHLLVTHRPRLRMAAKKKHAPSVLLTDEENDKVRDILGQKRYVSILRDEIYFKRSLVCELFEFVFR